MIWFLRFCTLLLIAYFIIVIRHPVKILNIIRTMIWLEEIEEDSFKAWLNRFLSIIAVIFLVFILIKSFFY